MRPAPDERSAEADWKFIADFRPGAIRAQFRRARRDIPSTAHPALTSTRKRFGVLPYSGHRHGRRPEPPWRITNNETYFREPHHFAFIPNQVIPPQLCAAALSAGCSSGEEPYSLIVNLVDSGLELQGYRWEIDACDLSTARIEQARKALYEPGSLRACDDEARQRCFIRDGERFQLKGRYRKGVNFFQTNLAAPTVGLGRRLT